MVRVNIRERDSGHKAGKKMCVCVRARARERERERETRAERETVAITQKIMRVRERGYK